MYTLYAKDGKEIKVEHSVDKKEYLASGHYSEKPVNKNIPIESKGIEKKVEEPVHKTKPRKRKGM